MSKADQKIIAVKKEDLFEGDYFEGFKYASEIDYESRILSNLKVVRRGSTKEPANHPEGNAERNRDYKQPIGYTLIINPLQNKVFAYQRSSKDNQYGEKRLQGKWSWGVGGHIEPFDSQNGNPIRESVLREVLKEEVSLEGNVLGISVLGYINDDSNSVGEVHFGVLYLIETDGNVKSKDPEIQRGELMSLGELEKISASPEIEVESWSKIALAPLTFLLSQ